ncbi:EAL domain-containing protein [Pseudoduganella umbonata]|uniref:cyclic-guanylate-specific phosphodiesterase n=1 Tax=Pseudoduganella umbonata TaxID=864828 RepID=A0A4P8HPK9_9BURK|nr:EAL domain-containing protein [Pseudoduganella umbonata]MBB3221288.1 sensor c-di-GMP phosphodiesterase-like protein [Pseudoduganella umbonata]QCP10462.1 EAL domain-containing protein [Pseudoduganella umbonata]
MPQGSTRKKALYALILLAALGQAVLLPWLAWKEAQRQAFDAEAELALAFARDVRYRADQIVRQVDNGIALLVRSGYPPCSDQARALMREVDLTSTHLQAIGYSRDGVMVCSSLGDAAIELGSNSFVTGKGTRLFLNVPVGSRTGSALMAVERQGFTALVHRSLPLDTWTAVSGVSVAVMQLDRPRDGRPIVSRGHVDPAWVARLGHRRETAFADDRYVVAIVRSPLVPSVAVAALPLSRIAARAESIAIRLVPAGLAAGIAVAVAIMAFARRQMSVAAALRHGLAHHAFILAYQPIVDLRTGRCIGAEALLRMRRDSGELIGPDLFIPIAEQTGLITRMTERVFELVEQDAGHFLARHPDFHIALNISAADLRSASLLPSIDRLLQRTGARPANLIVEITERGFVDPATARRALAALRERGIAIAIDDFGTGYSSLSYLESLDVDLLKIDRSFIETIGTGAPTSQVVGHIIAMARTIGLRMIAEGIETREQAEFVRRQGVEYAQGWLFGKPVEFRTIEQLCAIEAARPPGEMSDE